MLLSGPSLIKKSQERDITANYEEHGSQAREDAGKRTNPSMKIWMTGTKAVWYRIQNLPPFPDLRRVEEFGGRSEALLKKNRSLGGFDFAGNSLRLPRLYRSARRTSTVTGNQCDMMDMMNKIMGISDAPCTATRIQWIYHCIQWIALTSPSTF
ncbi:hypothetical protein C8J57DRAFT_1247143 [Mycena rebaudengoi]|nr:hypothetical protein C8J57DRAFT_1247143 [Mycena rebaudengoi]